MEFENKLAQEPQPPPQYAQTSQPGYPPLQQPGYVPLQQQPQVVVSQPTAITTTVITTQQGPGKNMWTSGTCDCFNDCKSCLCAVCFGNCYYACVASRMGENCCVGLSGYPGGCVPGGHLAMRSRFRGTHNIGGDICSDCFMTQCCLPCSMCQLSREMDRLGYPPNCC